MTITCYITLQFNITSSLVEQAAAGST